MGLAGPNFDHFFHGVEKAVLDYPYEYSEKVPDSGETWMRLTPDVQPDLPALYVYYKVNYDECRIRFLGVSKAWSYVDLAPPPFRD